MSVSGSGKSSNTASIFDTLSPSNSLLARLKTGQPEAWTRITRLFAPVVQNWCQRCGLSAEAAAALSPDVFQMLSEANPEFEPTTEHQTFTEWLWEMTRKRLLAFYKNQRHKPKKKSRSSSPHPQVRQLENNSRREQTSEIVDSRADRKLLLQSALELVKAETQPQSWHVFWQVAVEGKPFANVAADLKLQLANIYVIRGQMLRRIRDDLQDLSD